jgi:CBS-domain-containing membrane protein
MTEELVDLEAYREQLVEKLESMREFRSTESAESNADQFIDHAAEVLRTSVHEVEALPAHDARLRALAIATQGHDDLRRARYIEQEDHLIGRHGLSDGTRSTDELLAALAAAASAAD